MAPFAHHSKMRLPQMNQYKKMREKLLDITTSMEQGSLTSSVNHLIANTSMAVSQLISHELNVDEGYITRLIQFGGVFLNNNRILNENTVANQGDYLRVHLQPKRFPAYYTTRWSSRILHESPEHLIINKPHGVPVHASVDNYVENVCYAYSQMTGKQVYCPHRLDVDTSGLVVLAKTKQFVAQFNQQMMKKEVHKEYKALCPLHENGKCLEKDLLTHYICNSNRSPRSFSAYPSEGWKICLTKVLNCTPQKIKIKEIDENLDDQEMHMKPKQQSRDFSKSMNVQELHLMLVTGRTHQLRGQLAAEGIPILGDPIYGNSNGIHLMNQLALQAYRLQFCNPINKKWEDHCLEHTPWKSDIV